MIFCYIVSTNSVALLSVYKARATNSPFIGAHEVLTPETPVSKTFYGGYFPLSTSY